MFDFLTKYGLPRKYAIIGFFSGILAAVAEWILGSNDGWSGFVLYPLACIIGGYIGGHIRRRRGMKK
ncbi:hypothetical protein KHP62_12055 [Rhodobacteraceae bacterium NNCM2]|nr:hypothetical protein [Coraliihabitans acroporae]